MQTSKHENNMIYMRKAMRCVSKQGHHQLLLPFIGQVNEYAIMYLNNTMCAHKPCGNERSEERLQALPLLKMDPTFY